MKRKILVTSIFVFCTLFSFSLGRKDKIITEASVDNIEVVSQKKKFAWFYSDDNANAIQVAIRGGNLSVAEWLAENEICDLNHQDIFGRTPINDAIEAQDTGILKVLVSHGARIRREKYLKDPVVQTVVIGNLEAAEFFRSIGIRYDFVMPDGKNMIHFAVQSSQKDMIPFLVKNGCKIDAPDSQKQTPLLLSIANDDSDMVLSLITNGSSIERKNDFGETPIFFAVEKNSNLALQALIEKKADIEAKDSKNRNPFVFAYDIDNFSAASTLIKAGSSFPKTQLIKATSEQKLSYLPLLLDAGADINVSDSNGQNVLHIASQKSDGNSLSLFLIQKSAGNIINSKDKKGNTPLLIACGTGTGFTNGVQSLLDSGASAEDSDSKGNFPIHISVMNNPDSSSKQLCQILCRKSSSALNALNLANQSALMLALKNSKSETSSYLIGLKADVKPKDSSGNTALHYACYSNMASAVKEIVGLGASINAVNNNNENPVCISAKKQNESISDYFLSLTGINIDISDSSGKSARTYLWNLYDLRIEESRRRREEYSSARQRAWDSIASMKDSKYDVERKIRELENKNRELQAKINYADKDTNTSGWQSQITANNFALIGYNASLTAYTIGISRLEREAADYSKKIDEEFAISKSYIAKKSKLNDIPRQ